MKYSGIDLHSSHSITAQPFDLHPVLTIILNVQCRLAGLRLRCELAHTHVVDHALAQRAESLEGMSHDSAPVE
jgi:hypothetical protein